MKQPVRAPLYDQIRTNSISLASCLPAFFHYVYFFFFQAEDGIRDLYVTGVQTCALPIFFTREGNNIRLNLPVTLKEAVLGAKVKVPTPEGPVMVTIPKGTSSGKVLRLKGRGFTAKDGKRGDPLIALEIEIPAQDAALQQFAEGWNGGGNPRAGLGV